MIVKEFWGLSLELELFAHLKVECNSWDLPIHTLTFIIEPTAILCMLIQHKVLVDIMFPEVLYECSFHIYLIKQKDRADDYRYIISSSWHLLTTFPRCFTHSCPAHCFIARQLLYLYIQLPSAIRNQHTLSLNSCNGETPICIGFESYLLCIKIYMYLNLIAEKALQDNTLWKTVYTFKSYTLKSLSAPTILK